MKIAAGAGDRFAAKPDPNIAAVLLYGPDRGLARERADALLKAWAIPADDPFALIEVVEGDIKSDAAKLADELRAMTLTGGARAVRIRAGGDAAAATLKMVLNEIDSGALNPAAFLLVEAGELTKRSKLRVVFENAKRAAATPCYEDSARDLARILDDALKAEGLTITPDAAARALPRLEGDRALARSEIEKLALYKGPGSPEPITVEDVDAIASGAEPVDLDDIVTTILGGDVPGADRAVGLALTAGVNAVAMVRALQRRLYQLHAAADVYEQRRDAEAAMKGIYPPLFGPRRAAFKVQLSIWSGARLADAIAETLRTETRLKSTGAADATLISRLALALAGQARRARR